MAMTSSRINFAMVGGFVLAALVTLVVSLAILAGRTGATDRYYTEYANVSGLKFGSQVVYEGYPVGQVESITPTQEGALTSFRIELSVRRGWKIPVDSTARPVAPGVLAAQTISIAAGKKAEFLQPGGRIQPAHSVDLLSSISSAAGTFDELTDKGLLPLVQNLDRQVSTLGEILSEDVKPAMHDVHAILAVSAQRWPQIAGQAEAASAHLASASERLDAFLSPSRMQAIDHLIATADRTTQSLANAADRVDGLVSRSADDVSSGLADFRYLLATIARFAEPVSENIDVTSRNFRDFSRQIRQNPGVVLRNGMPEADPVPPLRARTEPR
jgi:phospholipid/cholesterol/gamma-HCH transport system substrate-binding protein